MTPFRASLVTGATGALGKRFVADRLRETDETLYLLARPKGRRSAEDRLARILAPAGLDGLLGTRVRVLEGDVAEPGFGLGPGDLATLRREVDAIFHVAALTELNGDEDACRRVNVGGTEHALELASDLRRAGRLRRLFYFSTAYVAGSRLPYHALEDEVNPEPAHANHYESSKYAAEALVRRAMAAGLPATIFRPSIVVGDSKTGAVSDFNVFYPLMKLFAHGILTVLPARPENTFNIVPIDYVIDAVGAIARRDDAEGRTYHLVTTCPPSIGTLIRVKDVDFPTMPRIEFLDAEALGAVTSDPTRLGEYRMIETFLGYLDCRLTFDTSNTDAALEGSGVEAPRTDDRFLSRIIRYAVDAGYLLA